MASVFKRGGSRAKCYWNASWHDHNGKRKTKSTRTTDKATAERIAKKFEADAALRREGVIDPALDEIGQQSLRSIESHLTDFESKLRAANRSADHVSRTVGFIRQIAEYAAFQTAADITADGVNKYAGQLRDERRAARTIGAHLAAIKAFTKWLTEHHKLPRDPLASVKKPNPKADRRRERRAISPEEWRRLEASMLVGPERLRMPAAERLALYRTAIQTGLRSNELRSLTRRRLYLDAAQPFITCKAGSTKNHKVARQYIQPELAVGLRELVATKSPKAPVFSLPHETNVAQMLRDDLAAARKAWLKEAKHDPEERTRREQTDFLTATSHEGEVFDFHCLRHTCGAWLAKAGVHPKTIQTIMRHSTITLTMDTYGHLFPGQEADAVAKLRGMMITDPPQAMQATGTDDLALFASEGAQRQAQQSARETGQSSASRCEEQPQPTAQKESPKPLQIADLGDPMRADASLNASSPGGTRTPDQGIMSPLL